MYTEFYNRTPYEFLHLEVPDCFLRLDEYFNSKISSDDESTIFNNILVQLAENLCYRMGDVDLYPSLIEDLSNRDLEIWNPKSPIIRKIHSQSILSRSLLVDYFSACKSLFDAGAIILDRLYQLGLNEKEQDFRKGKILACLDKKSISHYEQFQCLANDIAKNWRDIAVHRVPPMVIPIDSRIIPGSLGKGFIVGLFGEMKKGRSDLIGKPTTINEILDAINCDDEAKKEKIGFCGLTDLHEEWRPTFISFCEIICKDIEKCDFDKGYIALG